MFIKCPRCGKSVSKKDHSKTLLDLYGFTMVDAFLPIPCFHCGKSSYEQDWDSFSGKPEKKLTEDLFEI